MRRWITTLPVRPLELPTRSVVPLLQEEVIMRTSRPGPSTPTGAPRPVVAATRAVVPPSASDITRTDTDSQRNFDDIRDEYIKAALLSDAKSRGCAPGPLVQDAIMKYLKTRAPLEKSYMVLFNFHETAFAEKLLEQNCGKLVLVEASLQHAKEAKAFAMKKATPRVVALRGDHALIFGTGSKSKTVAFHKLLPRNWDKLADDRPLSDDEKALSGTEPLLIFVMPTVMQQTNMISLLKRHLFTHYCQLGHGRTRTLYGNGPVQIMTFLNTATFATLLSGTDPDLHFFGHAQRRASYLFSKMFRVDTLPGHDGDKYQSFQLEDFSPPIPPVGALTHESKMKPLGFERGRVLPLIISPRRFIQIAGRPIQNLSKEGDTSGSLSVRDLLKFAWFLHAIGKAPSVSKTSAIFKDLWPVSGGKAFLAMEKGCIKLNSMPSESLERAFLCVRDEITVPEEWITKELALP